MAREIPESEVATMEALVKCGVVMVSIALVYQHIEQENRTMNERQVLPFRANKKTTAS
jgi:hypothetical protein